MNAYDFDKTIFRGDSTAKFYLFCLMRTPKMLLRLPRLAFEAAFVLKKDKQRFKQNMFAFLTDLKDPQAMVEAFWRKNAVGIKRFYLEAQRPDDLIASASPEFLLKPICGKLGISRLIASPVDIKTGRYQGANCHGEEKVRIFRLLYPGETIEKFYSDSHSDDPMAAIAKEAVWVRGDRLYKWPAPPRG